jgi:ribosomal-protein-alanine N-acetyltransferase
VSAPEGIEVRALEWRDVEAATRIAAASFRPGAERPEFEDELGRSIARVHVACVQGEVVGYVLGWLAADQAEILSIAVDPDRRTRGVGRALLDHFVATMALHGASHLLLEVRASNGAAIALYEAKGLVRRGVRRSYYADGEDALTYRLELPDAR